MNIGKYIFAQVIDFIPRYQFDKLVKKYKGDWWKIQCKMPPKTKKILPPENIQ